MKLYRSLVAFAFVACIAGAGWQLTRMERGGASAACRNEKPDPMAVEQSFADETKLVGEGKKDAALLSLRKKAEKGPNDGAALYLMGELALAEKAYPQALEFWQAAIKKAPYLGDKPSPFNSADKMLLALNELKAGPMKGRDDGDAKRLNQLIRRLSGGCQ